MSTYRSVQGRKGTSQASQSRLGHEEHAHGALGTSSGGVQVGSNRGVLGLRRAGQSRFEPKTALHGPKSLKAALRCQKSSEAPLARPKVHESALARPKVHESSPAGTTSHQSTGDSAFGA